MPHQHKKENSPNQPMLSIYFSNHKTSAFVSHDECFRHFQIVSLIILHIFLWVRQPDWRTNSHRNKKKTSDQKQRKDKHTWHKKKPKATTTAAHRWKIKIQHQFNNINLHSSLKTQNKERAKKGNDASGETERDREREGFRCTYTHWDSGGKKRAQEWGKKGMHNAG